MTEELISTIGLSKDLWINKVRRTADDALKRALGTISTGQFYDPMLREKQVEVALDFMNKGSGGFGIGGLQSKEFKLKHSYFGGIPIGKSESKTQYFRKICRIRKRL